jgi:hypothetical protein
MDTHRKVVGILHVIFGAISLALIAIATVFFGVLSTFVSDSRFPMPVALAIGAAVAAVLALVALAEIVAGAMLLAGRAGARHWVIGVGALQLLNIPFGTALGAYTLWALTNEPPPMVIVSTPTSLSQGLARWQ